MDTDLHSALLRAHANGDDTSLIALYSQAGDAANDRQDIDAACFFWTHAYVFALAKGDARAAELHALLKSHGRES